MLKGNIFINGYDFKLFSPVNEWTDIFICKYFTGYIITRVNERITIILNYENLQIERSYDQGWRVVDGTFVDGYW